MLDIRGGYAREKLSAPRGELQKRATARVWALSEHKLLVSLHYSLKMLQTCAGEAAGRLTVPEAH